MTQRNIVPIVEKGETRWRGQGVLPMKSLDERTGINLQLHIWCSMWYRSQGSAGCLTQNSSEAFRALQKANSQSPITAVKTWRRKGVAITTPQDPITPHDVILAICFGNAGVVRHRWGVTKGRGRRWLSSRGHKTTGNYCLWDHNDLAWDKEYRKLQCVLKDHFCWVHDC